jgi:cysteine dioxygenase
MARAITTLHDLRELACRYTAEGELPIRFDGKPYTRIPIHRDDAVEIVVICFAEGQTSSVHNHEGSNCVVRVVSGKVLESLFSVAGDGTLRFERNQHLSPGDVSGLDGTQVHQISNLDSRGSVLLNFYSPPFRV